MEAWESFLKQAEQDLGKDTVDNWLRSLQILRFDACNLYLQAKDSFQALWFEEHMRLRLETQFFNNNKKRIKVHLKVSNNTTPSSRSKAKKSKATLPAAVEEARPFSITFEDLDPNSTFDSFLSSEDNLLTYKLLQETAGTNGSQPSLNSFNPIFVHGASGVGKSHLLMATAHALTRQGFKAVYSRAETFTEHVVSAIRAGEMQAFRRAYRNIDVLLIDNLHILSRKNATQEEFFHTFNTLHLAEKQIILSANCAPQELKYIEPRLISRFEWGIVLPLGHLQKKEMPKLLKIRTSQIKFPMNPEISDFLLSTFTSSSKALCRAIDALSLRCHLEAIAVPTLELTQQYLVDLIEEEKRVALTENRIIQAVSKHYGITVDDILGKSQTREYVLPRQMAMYLCRSQLTFPFMKIGEIFSRDHSTVMSSIKQIKKLTEDHNSEVAGSLSTIQSTLKSL